MTIWLNYENRPRILEMLSLCAFQLGQSLGLAESDVRSKLDRLLAQHEKEWKGFMDSLGRTSFLGNWANGAQS